MYERICLFASAQRPDGSVNLMAVFRVSKTRDYTVMSNSHLREKDMSLKAKGLLSLMLSLPDDWDYSIQGLCALSKDGYEGVMNALKELEKFRYLSRTRTTDSHGHFAGYDYNIFERPQAEKPSTEEPKTDFPITEKPSTEKPYTGQAFSVFFGAYSAFAGAASSSAIYRRVSRFSSVRAERIVS